MTMWLQLVIAWVLRKVKLWTKKFQAIERNWRKKPPPRGRTGKKAWGGRLALRERANTLLQVWIHSAKRGQKWKPINTVRTIFILKNFNAFVHIGDLLFWKWVGSYLPRNNALPASRWSDRTTRRRMPKQHSSHAFSFPGFPFKAVFFRKNIHTQDLVQLQFSCYSFYVGREHNSLFQELFIPTWGTGSIDEKTDVMLILLGLSWCTGRYLDNCSTGPGVLLEHTGVVAEEFRRTAGGTGIYGTVMMGISLEPHWDQVKTWIPDTGIEHPHLACTDCVLLEHYWTHFPNQCLEYRYAHQS